MGKRKNSSSIPRHKRMKRPNRLQAAKNWLPTYLGKNIVRGYVRHFAVDLLCAVKELEMLGNQFKPEYIDQLKRTITGQIEQKQERKRLKEQEEMLTSFESDDRFCYIAGYTSGGAPYGVTWEEMDCDGDCYDESYLFEDRLDDIDMDEDEDEDEVEVEVEVTNFEAIDNPGWFLEVTEEEDEIPF